MPVDPIAYFSMEVALESDIPTYSGGLGVLAGDTLRAAADLSEPMVGVSLVHRKGYFRQRLDEYGVQHEEPQPWSPEGRLEPVRHRVEIDIGGRPVVVAAWRYDVRGRDGFVVPVYLLDTDLPENDAWTRELTDALYGGDARYRLAQEAVLGYGGIAMLRAIGPLARYTYHLNEGHAALLTLALIEDRARKAGRTTLDEEDVSAVRQQCVFTTHTPVPAGHDRFPAELVEELLGAGRITQPVIDECVAEQGELNMTHLALTMSRYVNGVAMRHGQVSRSLFPGWTINAVTNGVHAPTWVARPFQRLFDERIPEWRKDSQYLRYAVDIPLEEIEQAHAEAKHGLMDVVRERTGLSFDPEACTLVFARRATPYKRLGLLFEDTDRLASIAERAGPLQVVLAGKAHPKDQGGKELIQQVTEAARELRGTVEVVYLEGYDMALGQVLCAGADVWLNTPQVPHEASGTSGMKAALNGVPSLSTLDGWWVEGCVEWFTGWAIGETAAGSDTRTDARSLYEKLEHAVLATFYQRPTDFASIRRSTIALNGSFFTAERMVRQYMVNAYPIAPAPEGANA